MNVKSILLTLFCTLVLATKGQVNDISKDIDLIINTVSPKFENDIEGEIVYKQLEGFFKYIKEFKGDKKWEGFIIDYTKTKSISISMLNVYDMTPYQLAGFIAYKLDKKLPPEESYPLSENKIDEFTLITQDKTKASEDLSYIEYLVNSYASSLKGYFFQKGSVQEKYYKNIDNLIDKNIKIYLLTNKERIKHQFGSVNGMAAALIGHEVVLDSIQINTRILFKYYELFTMSAMVHELTHIIWAYSYVNPKYTRMLPIILPDSINEQLQMEFKVFSDESPLKEGIAEYMNSKFNLLVKYGFFDDVDIMLRYYFKKTGEHFDLSELPKRIYDPTDKAPTYDIAHSLFKYICNNHGFDKAMELTYSSQTENDYYKILGVEFEEINRGWNSHVISLEE